MLRFRIKLFSFNVSNIILKKNSIPNNCLKSSTAKNTILLYVNNTSLNTKSNNFIIESTPLIL